MSVTWSVVPLSERAHRLVLEGSVDLSAEQPLVDAVSGVVDGHGPGDGDHDGQAPCTCEIDLTGVTFIDSSGVRALLRLVRAYGPRVSVGPVSESVQRVLAIAGVDDWLSSPHEGSEAINGEQCISVRDGSRREGTG